MKTPRATRSARRPAEVSGPFVCSWSSVGDCAVVRVAGTVDVRTAPTFAHELAVRNGGWLRASGAGQWLADLMRATGAGRPLEHYPTLAEALPAYRPAIRGITSRL